MVFRAPCEKNCLIRTGKTLLIDPCVKGADISVNKGSLEVHGVVAVKSCE